MMSSFYDSLIPLWTFHYMNPKLPPIYCSFAARRNAGSHFPQCCNLAVLFYSGSSPITGHPAHQAPPKWATVFALWGAVAEDHSLQHHSWVPGIFWLLFLLFNKHFWDFIVWVNSTLLGSRLFNHKFCTPGTFTSLPPRFHFCWCGCWLPWRRHVHSPPSGPCLGAPYLLSHILLTSVFSCVTDGWLLSLVLCKCCLLIY